MQTSQAVWTISIFNHRLRDVATDHAAQLLEGWFGNALLPV